MHAYVKFEIDGQEVIFETAEAQAADLFAAGAVDSIPEKSAKHFDAAIGMIRPLISKFVAVLASTPVREAEMALGLKVTAKGDFIIVGSSGEASLNLKLKLAVK
jgi:hypothetical protein